MILILAGCNDSESGGDAIAPIKAWFPELNSYTYSEAVLIDGDLWGIGNGSIEIYNSLTGQKITAQQLTQEECYDGGYIFLFPFFFIPIKIGEYCTSDESFAAVVPVDIGINEITAEVLDNTGAVLQSKSYSVERLPKITLTFSDVIIDGGELDQAFSGNNTEYTASACFKTDQINIKPILKLDYDAPYVPGYNLHTDFIKWNSSSGTVTEDGLLDVHLNEGVNQFELRILYDTGNPDNNDFFNPDNFIIENAYKFTIERGFNTNALLDSLVLSVGQLDDVFNSQISFYTASFSNEDEFVQIAPSPADNCAVVSINNDITTNNQYSDPIRLGEGPNLIAIKVDDGVVNKTYSLMGTRDSTAEYLQSTYIKFGSDFGKSVAVGVNKVAASRSYDLVNVYARDNSGAWNQQILSVTNTRNYMSFGRSMAFSENTFAIGAPYREFYAYVPGSPQFTWVNAGSVYVYTLSTEGVWVLQDTLIASNFFYLDEFGYSVAVDNETIAIGAPGKDGAMSNSGAVYIYKKDVNNNWVQAGSKTPTESGSRFGLSVALHSNTLAVGDEAGVYVYSIDELNPTSQFIYPLNASASDDFGYSLSVYGDTLVVGSPREDSDAAGINGDETNNNATASGAVYVYVRNIDGDWEQQAYIKPSNTQQEMSFGYSVSLNRDILAIGAFREDSQSTGVNSDQTNVNAEDSGAVYLYKRNATGVWTQIEFIKASNTDAGDHFGRSVGLTDGLLAVGAPQEDSGSYGINGDQSDNSSDNRGAVYLFE